MKTWLRVYACVFVSQAVAGVRWFFSGCRWLFFVVGWLLSRLLAHGDIIIISLSFSSFLLLRPARCIHDSSRHMDEKKQRGGTPE